MFTIKEAKLSGRSGLFFVLGVALTLAMSPLVLRARDAVIEHVFTAGEPVSAEQFNDNFAELEAAIDDNDARLDSLESRRYQTKFLSGDVAANGTQLTDLNFSNLDTSRHYRVNIFMYAANTNTNNEEKRIMIMALDGATPLAYARAGGAGSSLDHSSSTVFIYQPTSSELNFEIAGRVNGTGLRGDGTFGETFVQLEELPAHSTASAW